MKQSILFLVGALLVAGGVYWYIQTNGTTYADLVRLDTPRAGEVVHSPLTISGVARGQWYFEATFPFRLEDADGTVITQGFATAQGEWMTTEFVPFVGEVLFEAPGTSSGKLIIERSNPSGLPEQADEFSIPIRFQD